MSNKQQNGRISSNNSNTDGVVYRGTADPRVRKASSSGDPNESVCRDFVWGICSKGAQCKYRHKLTFEVMKRILKFCHDYQNKSGCTRPGCTYLHISNEEENLFLTSRHIPKILQERYAAMSANSSTNIYFNDLIVPGTPPPPPPIPPVVRAPVPPQVQPGPLPTLLAPPPPPPPPPPTVTTVTTVPANNTPPVFTAPPPVHNTAPLQPNAELPLFDASKPPPSLPSVKNTAPKVAVKRSADSSTEAAPSKLLKEDVPKLESGPCKTCVHKKLRVEMYQKKEQKIECELEYQTFKFQKMLDTFESGRKMLQSKVGPDLFRILDGYVQSAGQQSSSKISEPKSPFNQGTQVGMGSSSTLQRQFLCGLMELTQNLVELDPRQSARENGKEVNVQSFLEMIRNATRNPEKEEIGLNKTESEKNSSPAVAKDYPNKPIVPAVSLTPTTSTSVVSSVTSTTAHKSAPHVYVQSNTALHSPQNVRISTHQQPASPYGPSVSHSPSPVGTHISNKGSAPAAPPAQPVAPPVRALGATPPQGVSPQLQIQPALSPQGVPQPMVPAQHRMQLQNGHVMLPPQAMHPQRGAHPQNVPPVGVPPSIYLPYQSSVPPLNRPQYAQYPPTPNKASSITPQVRTGVPQLSAPRPSSSVAPLQNGCLKNSTLPHYYSGYP